MTTRFEFFESLILLCPSIFIRLSCVIILYRREHLHQYRSPTYRKGVVRPVLDALDCSVLYHLDSQRIRSSLSPNRDSWGRITPFVVSDRPFCGSSYPCSCFLCMTSSIRNLAIKYLISSFPSSDGLPRLTGVNTELEQIRATIRNSDSVRTTLRLLESSVGTVEEVLALMKEMERVQFGALVRVERRDRTAPPYLATASSA